jgi:hypothetical protein
MPTTKVMKDVKVWFYRAERATTSGQWPTGANPESHIRGKLAKISADPYIDLLDGSFIVETYTATSGSSGSGEKKNERLHLAVSAVRRDNLPLKEHKGATAPLELPPEDNLAEQAHLVFLPNSVVGFVRSQMAPGHLKASSVLSKRCDIDLILTPIVRPEIETILNGSRGVVELEFRVAGSSFDATAANSGDPVEAAHRLTSQFQGAGKADLRFTAQTAADRQRFRSWIINNLERLIGGGAEKARATIIDTDGQRRIVDLLEEQIAVTAEVHTRPHSRSLDPASAREAIQDAYNQQLSVITRAIELSSS